jgi:hypothetical protein
MQTAIERGNPTGGQPAGLQDTAIERVLNVPENNSIINRIELIGSFCHSSKSAIILLAGEVQHV